MQKPTPKPVPTALSMVICDMVMDDRRTGKKILIGTFNNIMAVAFPVVHPELHIFLSLTEGHGPYEGSLNCIKSDSNETIMDIRGPINFDNPLAVVELDFALKTLRFQNPGVYIFQFSCDDQLIISRKFRVSKTGGQKDEK